MSNINLFGGVSTVGVTGQETVEAELLVVGESEGGVVAAVRAAREGVATILATATGTLGGVFPSLGAIETHYHGKRAPLLTEIEARITEHYRARYGADSEQYQTATARDPMVTFEPHVAEAVLRGMCGECANLRILWRHVPVRVAVREREIAEVELAGPQAERCRVRAHTFIDATYTGDLTALAGVPVSIGRESRERYGEAHAGRLFTRWVAGRYPLEAAEGRLNLTAKATTLGLLSGSSGEGDDNVMAYSYRLCLCDDPDNRVDPPVPPGYDSSRYRAIALDPQQVGLERYALHHRFLSKPLRAMIEEDHLIHGHRLPNRKRSWNASNYPGAGKGYAQSDAQARREIEAAHLNHALGILHFLRTDSSVPADVRQEARQWGLARDEFESNGHVPEQLYVREARRMLGRAVLTENDAIVPRGLGRAPLHPTSVATTEFPLDSLACTTERVPGSVADGQFFLQELSRPAQIPYGVLLPRELDNLLSPGAASTSHVAWATVRISATFAHLAESAGFACALAKETGRSVADVPLRTLQKRLAERGVMLTFFNDVDMSTPSPQLTAVQVLGTRGLFADYDARLDAPLTEAVARVWLQALFDTPDDSDERAAAIARAVRSAEELQTAGRGEPGRAVPGLTARRFARMVEEAGVRAAVRARAMESGGDSTMARGYACSLLFDAWEGDP